MSKWLIGVDRLVRRLGISGGDGLASCLFGGFDMKNSSGGSGLAREGAAPNHAVSGRAKRSGQL
jgi:hypothetical protein